MKWQCLLAREIPVNSTGPVPITPLFLNCSSAPEIAVQSTFRETHLQVDKKATTCSEPTPTLTLFSNCSPGLRLQCNLRTMDRQPRAHGYSCHYIRKPIVDIKHWYLEGALYLIEPIEHHLSWKHTTNHHLIGPCRPHRGATGWPLQVT